MRPCFEDDGSNIIIPEKITIREMKTKKRCTKTKCKNSCQSFVVSSRYIAAADPVRLAYVPNMSKATVRQIYSDPYFQWSIQSKIAPINSLAEAMSIATDSLGNVFIAVDFIGTVSLGNLPPITTSAVSIFIAKISYDGVWSKVVTPYIVTQGIGTSGIAIDKHNNIYVTGLFFGTVQFDSTLPPLVTSANVEQAFIVALDNNLNYKWAVGTTSSDDGGAAPSAIITDGKNGVYITGSVTSGSVNFGSDPDLTIITGPSGTIFIAKADTDTGKWIWTNSIISTTNVTSISIVADCQNNIYVTGSFYSVGTITFDTIIPTEPLSTILFDSYVAKADALTGRWIYVTQTKGSAYANIIATDYRGHIYIGGYFTSPTMFGQTLLSIPATGVTDGFIAKLDTDLNWILALDIPSVILPNPAPLNIIEVLGITSDADENIYLSGVFNNNVVFGSSVLTNSMNSSIDNNNYNWFIAKLLPDSTWDGALQSFLVNPVSDAVSFRTASDYQGNIYTIGIFAGSIKIGTVQLTSSSTLGSGTFDIFVNKTVSDRTVRLAGVSPTTAKMGDTIKPLFLAASSGNLYQDLIPSFAYGINANGKLSVFSQATYSSDPGLKYVGTACSRTTLLLN